MIIIKTMTVIEEKKKKDKKKRNPETIIEQIK